MEFLAIEWLRIDMEFTTRLTGSGHCLMMVSRGQYCGCKCSNYDNFLTIYDGYYKSEDSITIHDSEDTTFDNQLDNIIASPLCGNAYLKLTVNDNKWTFILNHFKERQLLGSG